VTGSCSFEYLRSDKEMIVRLSVLTAEMNEVAAVCGSTVGSSAHKMVSFVY